MFKMVLGLGLLLTVAEAAPISSEGRLRASRTVGQPYWYDAYAPCHGEPCVDYWFVNAGFDVGFCRPVPNCNPERWLADRGIVAPQDCQGSFTEWSTCDCPTCADGDPERMETRTFSQTRPATDGGQPCEAAHGQVQTRECPRDPFTRWEGSWTEMSQSAGAYTFAEVYQEKKTFRSQSRYLERNNIRASNTNSFNWNVCASANIGFGISADACAGGEQSTTLGEEQSTAWESIFSQTATALQSRSLQRTWTCDGRTYQYVLKGRTASGRDVEVTTEQLTCFKSTSRLYNGRPECATAVTSADRVPLQCADVQASGPVPVPPGDCSVDVQDSDHHDNANADYSGSRCACSRTRYPHLAENQVCSQNRVYNCLHGGPEPGETWGNCMPNVGECGPGSQTQFVRVLGHSTTGEVCGQESRQCDVPCVTPAPTPPPTPMPNHTPMLGPGRAGETIALYSEHVQRFAQLNANGRLTLTPKMAADGLQAWHTWERFEVVDGGQGQVALYSNAHWRFVQMTASGEMRWSLWWIAFFKQFLPADWSWERFEAVQAGPSLIALYNSEHGRFVQINSNGEVGATAPTAKDVLPGPQALFRVVSL